MEKTGNKAKRIGKHRGMAEVPNINEITKQAAGYYFEQLEKSSMIKDQLLYMLTMGFPKEAIETLFGYRMTTWDLDFARILYFITGNMDYVKEKFLSADSAIYEDVLDSALEYVMEERYGIEYKQAEEELRETEEQLKTARERLTYAEEQLKMSRDRYDHRIAMAQSRIEFLKMMKESMSEEKSLQSETYRGRIEELKSEKTRIKKENDGLIEKTGTLEKENAAIKEELKAEKEKSGKLESRIQEMEQKSQEAERNAGDTSGGEEAAKNENDPVLEQLSQMRKEILEVKASITSREEGKTGDESGEREADKNPPEALNDGKEISPEEGRVLEQLTELRKTCEEIKESVNSLNVRQGEENTVKVLKSAEENSVCLKGMEETARKTGEAAIMNGAKLSRLLDRTDALRKEISKIQNEPRRSRGLLDLFQGNREKAVEEPLPESEYESALNRLVSNPDLKEEHFAMIRQAIDMGLPVEDFKKIAETASKTKLDTARLETILCFYFKGNGITYTPGNLEKGAPEADTGQNTDEAATEAESGDSQGEHGDGETGQPHGTITFDATE